MKKIRLLLVLFAFCGLTASAQTSVSRLLTKDEILPASKVDFDAFDSLTKEVKAYRKGRLIHLNEFLSFSKEKNTIILDARSTEMYNRKHIKGAVHLNFSDFSQGNLRRLIPNADTRVLIYCNNNFTFDELRFPKKSYTPPPNFLKKEITLALNIPTFINLYGYGYKNVYELADLVSVHNIAIEFEGTDVPK